MFMGEFMCSWVSSCIHGGVYVFMGEFMGRFVILPKPSGWCWTYTEKKKDFKRPNEKPVTRRQSRADRRKQVSLITTRIGNVK